MKLMKFVLVMAAGGLATHLLMKQRGRPAVPDGLGSWGPDPLEGELDVAVPMSGVGSESPNAAERLEGESDPLSGERRRPAEDLFSSSSQRGDEPIAPGLPDLTRGA